MQSYEYFLYFCTVKRNICFFLKEPLCILMFFFCGSQQALSAAESSDIEISLLTCQPHDEIYSLYGHTAIRVRNRVTNEDIAVNYGVFDPTVNFFVLRFIFGLTDYSMGICSYEDFLNEYRRWGCGVYDQHINMSVYQKTAFVESLLENSRPGNLVYRYNYFYNNCTTKARDIILDAMMTGDDFKPIGQTGGEIKCRKLPKIQQGEISFRDLVHMKTKNHPWARFGNDLLLGVAADANTTYEEREFLPEVLSVDFDSTSVYYSPTVSKELVDTAYWALAPGKAWVNPDNVDFVLSPMQMAIVVLLLFLIYFVCFEGFVLKHPVYWVHYAVCCLYAFVGIVLFLMLFSQHPTVRVNFQIFIFNPLFFIFALPKFMKGWGRYVVSGSVLLFFLGNIFQVYAEGANLLALALLATFTPFYFGISKKNSNFAS